MRVHIGSDHAGFQLKQKVISHLAKKGHEVIDHGADVYDPDDDYPAPCLRTGEAVVADPGSLAVVIGGSGNGEQIAANKVKGVRAILAWDVETATLGREHNNANVVGIGARTLDDATALELIDIFLATPFSEGDRHKRRIHQLATYEATGEITGG